LAGVATTKMRIARTKAELNQYVTAIESYKLETGSYPPDNGSLKGVTPGPQFDYFYKSNAAMNPLFYELTGAIFTNSPKASFRTVVGNETVTSEDLKQSFSVSGIQNSARNKNDIDYKGFSPKPVQYAPLFTPGDVEILAVPVPGPFVIIGKKTKINPWFYDSSTTNRHNKASFDLWAEITIGRNQTNIIANWKN
jgi:hypothetical protein